MENRIKEVQLNLFADRTSCHEWGPNQMRVLLSSVAYILFERLKSLMLQGTDLAKAQAGTLRLKLLKSGAVISRNTRRIRFSLSKIFSSHSGKSFRQLDLKKSCSGSENNGGQGGTLPDF